MDKVTRYNQEIEEAEEIWAEVSQIDYKEMKAKAEEKARKKEGISAQERAQAQAKQFEQA